MRYRVNFIQLHIKNNPSLGISQIFCVDGSEIWFSFTIANVIQKRIDGDFFYLNNQDTKNVDVEVIDDDSSYGGKCLKSNPKYSNENLLLKLNKYLCGGKQNKYQVIGIALQVKNDRTTPITHILCVDDTGNHLPFSVMDAIPKCQNPGDNYFFIKNKDPKFEDVKVVVAKSPSGYIYLRSESDTNSSTEDELSKLDEFYIEKEI